MKKVISVLIVVTLLLSAACGSNHNKKNFSDLSDQEFTLSQLSGTDALGRTVSQTTGNRKNKYATIYYFQWLGQHDAEIYDISKLLEKYENGVIGNEKNPLWAEPDSMYYDANISPAGKFHYWREPLFGYYNSKDPWVVRRHLEMLAYAQIDYICVDYTNNYIYEDAMRTLLDACVEMSAEGFVVPKVVVMFSAIWEEKAAALLTNVWQKFMSQEKWKDCFFVGDSAINPSGKPMVIGNFGEFLDSEIEGKIWNKALMWPGVEYAPDQFPGLDWATVNRNHNGYMSVATSIASSGEIYSFGGDTDIHWCSEPYLYRDLFLTRGRGYVPETSNNGYEWKNVEKGSFFDYQFEQALADDTVHTLNITGWNEFVAQKITGLSHDFTSVQRATFVDLFNDEFSRDIEPVKGGFGDNFYNQLVQKMQEWKGNKLTGAVKNKKTTIDIFRGFGAWADIENNYLDAVGDAYARNFQSVDPELIYMDNSNRNDIVRLKIANDQKNLYVMVETYKPVTGHAAEDKNWMNLYISTGAQGGFTGFNFVINRLPNETETSIEKIVNNEATRVGTAKYHVEDNRIFYEIPLSILGVSSLQQISVKATDNLQKFLDADDFYISGDSAPIGRLSYAYLLA